MRIGKKKNKIDITENKGLVVFDLENIIMIYAA